MKSFEQGCPRHRSIRDVRHDSGTVSTTRRKGFQYIACNLSYGVLQPAKCHGKAHRGRLDCSPKVHTSSVCCPIYVVAPCGLSWPRARWNISPTGRSKPSRCNKAPSLHRHCRARPVIVFQDGCAGKRRRRRRLRWLCPRVTARTIFTSRHRPQSVLRGVREEREP